MKKNSIIVVVLILLFLSIGVSGYIISKNTKPNNDNPNSGVEPNTPVDPGSKEDEPNVLPTDPKAYVGNYGHQRDNSGKVSFDSLYLREDGTFSFSYGDGEKIFHVGKYSINDNKLVLNTMVRYDNGTCFYKNNLQTFTLDILTKESFSFTFGSETIKLEKHVIGNEGSNATNFYSINPVDGQTANGVMAPWDDCTSN